MAGLIPQGFIEDLIARVPVSDVVGSRIQLKKHGGTYKACCPFHQEKTPSFHVNAQKNFYHCFGCGASGNSINFLREYENLSFNEAVEELAKIAGVDVPKDEKNQQAYSAQKVLLDALDYAGLRYRSALESHKNHALAQNYIKKRALSSSIIELYGIGFAPAERDFLSAKAPADTLKALIKTKTVSDKYERLFDLFQNRLMFPIRNARGKTIAFGGRTLGDDKAKYINSPESEVFHKSSEIYGLYEANQANRQIERLLVVEGYMDVVSLAQFGITYAVATLGTATNTESLTQLLKRCQNLVFCFDGDNAGIQAARKAMENALPLFRDGMQINFLLLPQGEDPDTLVRDEGQVAFERRIKAAQPLSEFMFQIYSEGLDLGVAEHKGVLKQRAEEQIELVKSLVLKNALRQKLNSLTFRRSGKKQTDVAPQRDLVSNKVLRDPDGGLCLALYYMPERAAEFQQALNETKKFPRAIEFSNFLKDASIVTTEGLLYWLATDMTGQREHFSDLFDRLDWVPNADEVQVEVEEVLQKIIKDKKQAKGLKSTKVYKRPSEMSAEEKQALRSISIINSKSAK
jgi:DNA primase